MLKKAAPIIGGSIGFAIGGPLGSAAIGSALGAGIGSLAAGADPDDALKAALLGGIGGYANLSGGYVADEILLMTWMDTQEISTGNAANPESTDIEIALN